jgi:hypothetical protein
MIDLICLLNSQDSVFYIDLHNQTHTNIRPWAILEITKWGPRQFDIYVTKEQAETAANLYGIIIIDNP